MFGFKSPNATTDDSNILLREVGVSEMNKQHIQLASYTVEFHQIVAELKDREATIEDWRRIDSYFSRIMKLAVKHFGEEEEMMEKYNFPDIENHKRLHAKFIEQMGKFQNEINGRNLKAVEKLSEVLWNWLYTHINEIDYGYRDFFKGKGLT